MKCGVDAGATDDKLLMVPRAKNAHHSARKDAMAAGCCSSLPPVELENTRKRCGEGHNRARVRQVHAYTRKMPPPLAGCVAAGV